MIDSSHWADVLTLTGVTVLTDVPAGMTSKHLMINTEGSCIPPRLKLENLAETNRLQIHGRIFWAALCHLCQFVFVVCCCGENGSVGTKKITLHV